MYIFTRPAFPLHRNTNCIDELDVFVCFANSSSDPEAHLVLICGRRNVTKNSVKLAKIPNISGTLCWVGFMFGCRSAATLNTESDRRRVGFMFRCRSAATLNTESDRRRAGFCV